jgi:hypothetical protein
MRARYYDPQTAQLLTRDPAEMLTREPYAYAQDNPLNETDPSGLGCGLFDPGGCINDAVNAAGGFVSRHASTIAFGAGVVGLLVPGVDVLDLGALGEMSINGALSAGATATSIGAGGIASAQDFSGGHYVSGILDAVGSIGGAGALYFDRLANADRLAAGEAWRSGTVQRWLLQDAAANASRARLTSVGAFGLGAIPNVLSLISGAPAWAATLCG